MLLYKVERLFDHHRLKEEERKEHEIKTQHFHTLTAYGSEEKWSWTKMRERDLLQNYTKKIQDSSELNRDVLLKWKRDEIKLSILFN